MIEVTDKNGTLIQVKVVAENGGSQIAAENSILEMLQKTDPTLIMTPAVISFRS